MVAALENVEALQENAGVTIYAVRFKIVVLTNLTIAQLQEGHL